MSKILVNNTPSDIIIDDVGVTVASLSNYTIPPQNYPAFAASSDIIRLLSTADSLILNDGGNDILVLSDAIDIIKGWPIQQAEAEETPFFFDYADIPVGAGPHTLASFFIDTGTTLDLTRLYVNCRMESFVQLLHNGFPIASLRTSAANPMASFDWRPNKVCVENDSIEIVLTKRTGAPDIDVGVHLMGVTTIT